MTKEQIGQAVRELRERNGIKTTDLQKVPGISAHHTSMIELANGRNYTIDTFLKYLRACGITLRQVVNYEPKTEE